MSNSTLHPPPSTLVVTYAPRQTGGPVQRDLLLLEQRKWGAYCGLLTRAGMARFLRAQFFGDVGEVKSDEELENENFVNCCGYGGPLDIRVYVYELAAGVSYSLLTTVGTLRGERVLETVTERESVTFQLETEAGIRHPGEIVRARWLTGPWTIGGAPVAAPPLAADGQTVRAPIPLYGTVELTLRVRRWRHVLYIPKFELDERLKEGWAEFVVALPSGGRPVMLAITEPPGSAELARNGLNCGWGRGGDSGRIDDDDDDDEDEEPEAIGEDKHIKCDYCKLMCQDE